MQRLRIEYADQNDSFRTILPRSGSVVRTLHDISTDRSWTLIRLDEPFEWQHKIGEPFQFRLMNVNHFLVAPRWVGIDIGGSEPAAVFIALVEKNHAPAGEALDVREYVGIAWGTCYTETSL